MKKKVVTAPELLKFISDETLAQLADETGVDWQVKKLWGALMFKLFLMSILQSNRLSLRVMEKIFQSPKFRILHGLSAENKTKHSSLSDRLATMNPDFFEAIFNNCFELLKSKYEEKEVAKRHIIRYDSTIISASAKLLKSGMENGSKNKQDVHAIKQVKFTIGFTGLLNNKVHFYNEQQHLGEDITLRETILSSQHSKDSIVVFDRGLKKRKTFVEFSQKDILFVTRINPTSNYDTIREHARVKHVKTETLIILSDQWVYLYHEDNRKVQHPFRLIIAQSIRTGEKLYFLTNNEDIDATGITEIYRCRWDIEVLIRFLKQELNMKHFFSYNENGIRIMMYMTMIAAMLFMVYKKMNKLSGFKIPMMAFIQELESELMKEIVAFCGGDPMLVNKFYPT